MSRTALAVRVELVSGRGEKILAPAGTGAARRPRDDVPALAEAVDTAFGRWDRAHLHTFDLADGTLLTRPATAAASGDVLLAPEVTRRLVERFVTARPRSSFAELQRLSTREVEVLRLIARGLSNTEMAAELFLAETTVKSHVSAVLAKLGLRDRVQAVVYAYESGVVQPGADNND